MFLKTVAAEDAAGKIAEIYAAELQDMGLVMEATACWTTRPEVLPLFEHFSKSIKANFSLGMRNWRLITFVAAQQVPSTYCTHVYARSLIKDLGSRDRVLALQRDFRSAGLDEKDVAMLTYAEQVAKDASKIMQTDIDSLQAHGFSDVEISDIALCASFRCFVSRFFDATGATVETAFLDSDMAFRDAMTVGRPL